MVAAPPQPQPEKPPATSAFLSFFTPSPLLWVSVALAAIPVFIFSYGAAKINWNVNQSYIWSIIAFFFSGFYYPYYAFFQMKTLGIVSSTVQAIGARRRR
jgi:hypothetical protein